MAINDHSKLRQFSAYGPPYTKHSLELCACTQLKRNKAERALTRADTASAKPCSLIAEEIK